MGSSFSCASEDNMANKLLPAAIVSPRSKHTATVMGKFVDSEVKAGIPIENIVIGGFSQGGSVALYNALTGTSRYGGVVAFSSWLPLHTKFLTSPTDVPIFQCHGLQDCTIPFAMGKLTHELLQTFRLSKCELKSYPHLSHSSCEQVRL
ncbi:unnamed protein product [Trichobilharzia regenti]|nr:unnamed protein product [Trichobilharzia regenti]